MTLPNRAEDSPALIHKTSAKPALSAMMQSHPPAVIFVMLGSTAVLAALLAGYGMAGRQSRRVLHPLVFAVVMATAIYVILDLEYPRLGLIRIDGADQILVDVRNSMR